MPAVDAPRGNNAAAKPPPVPKLPPTSTRTSNNPRGVAIAPVRTPAPSRTVTTGANPRGTAIVQPSHGPTPSDVQATHPDPQTTVSVFRAQPLKQQQQIVKGALQHPTVPASRIILDFVKTLTPGRINASTPAGGNYLNLMPAPRSHSVLSDLAKIFSPASVYGARSAGVDAAGAPKGNFGAVMFGGPSGAKQLLANAGKDAVNLPAETLSTVGTIGGDVIAGKPGKALSDFANPFVQLAEHPAQSFYQHPLNSYLMATGALHGASRLAAAPVRALAPESAVGRAVSTQREGVALTGKLTHERPAYSKSPTVKAQQKAVEAANYTRAPTGELVPRTDFLRTRRIDQGVGQLVGVRERIRTVNREAARSAREKAVTPSLAARAGHAAKTALAYGPKRAAIPGADVLARIADGTIRRPDTIQQDIATHLRQVSANRANLLDEPKALKAHDAYVKQLSDAAKNKAFLKNPAAAFKAAEAYRADYLPVQARAASLGHFGTMTADLLRRRELAHYAVTHMGAKMDEAGALVDAAGKPLSNQAILEHLKGPNGTGGRLPAFTPDRIRFDQNQRGSYYVSSERRPLPNVKKNTLYAYTHGLTAPGHEALTEQHVLVQGIVDSHRSQNAYLDTLATRKPGGGYWSTFDAAKRDAPAGYRPINISQPFHAQESLDQATAGTNPASVEEEAVRRSLDMSARLQPGTAGRWAIIDEKALKALRQHGNQISPNPLLRTIRGLNNQFRTVALSTSAKHIPGVTQENIIRDVANGVGFRSWITGRRLLSTAERINPQEGRDLRVGLTGGQVAGMTEAGKTYLVSDHWAGTNAYPFLKAFEAAAKAPGARQLRSAWKAWTRFAIGGTKHLLEQQHQIAGLGKAALQEHGYAEAARTQGFMGLVQRAFGLHGQMLEDAAKGAFDPAKARQLRAAINQMYGKWTDLSPSAQTALMFSPFGLWWANSARFIARMPTDMPVKTAALAGATTGTQQERQANGLDMFSPGALPLYEQGGIPVGGKILAQNYYSPFGVANDPIATGQSLIQPWLTPIVTGALGVDWLGKPLTSPGQNTSRGNEKTPNQAQRAQYILDSVLSSFVPLYTKAAQATEGGSSAYDVSPGGVLPPLVRGQAPATKKPGKGLAAGLEKATLPVREYKKAGSQGAYKLGGGAASTSSGGYVLGSGGQQSAGSGYVLGSGG